MENTLKIEAQGMIDTISKQDSPTYEGILEKIKGHVKGDIPRALEYNPSLNIDEDALMQRREQALTVTKIGIMSAVALVMVLFIHGHNVMKVSFYFILYALIYLYIAGNIGAMMPYKVFGYGKTPPILRTMQLQTEDIKVIKRIFNRRKLPQFEWFFPAWPYGQRAKLYEGIKEDLKAHHHPDIVVYSDLSSLLDENAEYVAIFWFMSLIYLVVMLIPLNASVAALAFVAIAEEFGKGLGYFVVGDVPGKIMIKGRELNPATSKGIAAGFGYSFIETFMRLDRGVNPLMNLAVRLVTALPLHVICSGMFFTGISLVGKWKREYAGKEKESMKDLAGGIMLMGGAIVLHFVYDVVGWLYV